LSWEEVVIARAGHPVARLVAIPLTPGKRVLGVDDGRGRIADDFDDPLPEDVLAALLHAGR